MSRILRLEVPADDRAHHVPSGIVHIGTRSEFGVEVWFHEPHRDDTSSDLYLVVGTGHPYDALKWAYVGTAITPSGRFVWHLLRAIT